MSLDTDHVNDLFQALEPEDIRDVTTKDGEWIIIHIIAPDGDATHYSLWIHLTKPQWFLRDTDNETGYRVMP